MEYENKHEFASKGVAGTGLGLAIGALGLNALNGGLGNIFGGGMNCGCSDGHLVNRYEAGQAARIAELETEVKLRDSNIYTDQKILDVYKYFDGENKAIRAALCDQAVKNAQIEGTFAVLGEQNKALRNEFMCALNRERDERCCGDNAIINYSNATFYPKLVADVTVGTTTTAQTLYNPLPGCGCGCNH
mgnify:CR=1 FL=1|jgi:hypothetical protein